MSFTEIRYEKRGHVGVITLDRPDARNALTYTTYAELEDAARSLAHVTRSRDGSMTNWSPARCIGGPQLECCPPMVRYWNYLAGA